jgi:uncharacterized membrane protein
METPAQEKNIYQFFRLSVLAKGAISALEIVGGLLILVVPPALVAKIVLLLTAPELIEDPSDFMATRLAMLAHQFALSSSLFIAFYLLSRGLIKLGLVVALLKNKLWAYPASFAVLGLFVLYQLYQIVMTHSALIIALTLFDFVVMYFIWREYQVVREHLHATT